MSSSSPAGARSPAHFGRFEWQTCRMLADCPNQLASLLFRAAHLFKQPADGPRMDSRDAHAKFRHVLQVVGEMHNQLQMDSSSLILNGFGTIYAGNLSDMALAPYCTIPLPFRAETETARLSSFSIRREKQFPGRFGNTALILYFKCCRIYVLFFSPQKPRLGGGFLKRI